MAYPAFPTFPTSTSTSFDDLTLIKNGDAFVIRGYEYRAHSDAAVERRNGIETVTIDAVRRHPQMPSGWELADVRETRAYVGPLDDICEAAR